MGASEQSIRGGGYGAVELKSYYNRNLGFALLCSTALHVGGILLYIALTEISEVRERVLTPGPPLVNTIIYDPNGPQPRPTEPVGGGGGVKSVMGSPVAVADHLVDTTQRIADITEAHIAVATPGDGSGGGPIGTGTGIDIGGGQLHPDTIPTHHFVPAATEKPDETVEFPQQEPTWDPVDLQRRLRYPPSALRAGIQGVVIVRVLVDRFGRIGDVVLETCDNRILCDAAIDAVRKTPFSPGVQAGEPVKTWVQVDVHFSISSE